MSNTKEPDANKEISSYGIGPFRMESQTITLSPGVYTLHKPVTFLKD